MEYFLNLFQSDPAKMTNSGQSELAQEVHPGLLQKAKKYHLFWTPMIPFSTCYPAVPFFETTAE